MMDSFEGLIEHPPWNAGAVCVYVAFRMPCAALYQTTEFKRLTAKRRIELGKNVPMEPSHAGMILHTEASGHRGLADALLHRNTFNAAVVYAE